MSSRQVSLDCVPAGSSSNDPRRKAHGCPEAGGLFVSLRVTQCDLFHLVVGKLPFDSSDDREVLRMQVMQSLESPELKGRGISHHLQYFIEKMMAKDLAARYQSWEELTGDVRAQIEGREALDFERSARQRQRRS